MILDENLNCIIVYDVEAKRDVRIHKELSKELYWMQRSVFGGDVGKGAFARISFTLTSIINPEKDSVVLYQLMYPWNLTMDYWGKTPGTMSLVA